KYMHLTGTIKEIPVTMNLFKQAGEDPILDRYYGTYYYNQYMEPIEVSGEVADSTGLIRLREALTEEDVFNGFVGNFDSLGVFRGEWREGYRHFSLPFELSESYLPGTVQLDFFDGNYVFAGDTTSENESELMVHLSTLWPQNDYPFLENELIKLLYGGAASSGVSGPKDLFEQLKTGYLEEYKRTTQELTQDSVPVGNFSYDMEMFCVWNEDSMLVLGNRYYRYEGGAHGVYGVEYANLDLKARHVLALSDVFLEGFENQLSRALESALRRKYDLRPQMDIREIVDVDKIPVTSNFYVTGGGIGFYYPPYELGAYALGDFEFFLRFEDIEELLKP
ncbi:MAG: DUF3298 domain-containing protein, partial [Bacteroidetes bacterium]